MVDELENETSESFDLYYYLGVLRRRHLHFLLPLLLGWILVWGVSWVLPQRYKSGTLILVEQPTMPKDYVTPNISDDLQERLQSITQQILSRTRLLHIIDKFKLYTACTRNHRQTIWCSACAKILTSSWCGTLETRLRPSTSLTRRMILTLHSRSPAS